MTSELLDKTSDDDWFQTAAQNELRIAFSLILPSTRPVSSFASTSTEGARWANTTQYGGGVVLRGESTRLKQLAPPPPEGT